MLLKSELDLIKLKNKAQLKEICKVKNIEYKHSENKDELVTKVFAKFRK